MVVLLTIRVFVQVKSRKNVISVKMISLKMVVLLTIRVFIQVKSRKNVISVKMISLKMVVLRYNHKSIYTGEKPFQNESFGIVTWTLFQPAICDPDSGTDAVHQNIFIYYKL